MLNKHTRMIEQSTEYKKNKKAPQKFWEAESHVIKVNYSEAEPSGIKYDLNILFFPTQGVGESDHLWL